MPAPSSSLLECHVVSDISSAFQYIKQLGTGASCRVLKAQHMENKQLYAVKELHKSKPQNESVFVKEVQLLRKLCHPNILTFYDCYEDDKCYYVCPHTHLCTCLRCLCLRRSRQSTVKAARCWTR